MELPVLLLLSRDHQLACDVAGWLDGKAVVRTCDQAEEFLDLSRQWKPQAAILDYRRVGGNGLSEVRFLDNLQHRLTDTSLAIMAQKDCPAMLANHVAAAGIPQLSGSLNRDMVLKTCQTLLNLPEDHSEAQTSTQVPGGPALPAPVSASSAPSVPRATSEPLPAQPLGALEGVTRRYETSCPRMTQMLRDLEVAARHDVTILLIGETGAGKTFLSRLIHEVSPRRHEPFLPVACGALPNDLIESELFGHTRGAFTSAHADKDGKFLAARRGSLLLDEIDVLGLEQQVKLLRVIETGEFEPVGSNQTLHCQARLIVASNLNLQPLVEQNKFRPDLYYRLNMLKFEIPPLRERRMDIMPLARKFIRQFSAKHQVTISEIDSSVFRALMSYPWPGNVRELEHVIQRAVIYCRDGILTAQQLPSHILEGVIGPTNDASVVLKSTPATTSSSADSGKSLGGQIALTEREIIEQTLFQNSFSRTRTSKELGISRVTLYNKMKRYGIDQNR